MAKHRLSPDDAYDIVSRVQELTIQGRTVTEACRELGLAPATYYRYRKIAGTHLRPALRKDWSRIARDWRHPLLDQLPTHQARNFRYAVADAVRGCFSVPAPIRQSDMREQLRELGEAITALLETYDGLGSDVHGLVDDIAGQSYTHPAFASTVHDLRHFAKEVSTLAQGLSEMLEESGSASGGRDRDSRIDSLTVALATLYARHTGKQPVHTYDPYGVESLPSSEFNKLVFDVFDHFLPELQVGRHTLVTAMRHAAARIDYSEDSEVAG